MASSPSEPLLQLLRDVARKKGMNTAALAKASGLDRAHLKHVLAGSKPLTVDELIQLSELLEMPYTCAAAPVQPRVGGAHPAPLVELRAHRRARMCAGTQCVESDAFMRLITSYA